ncbi:MAG: bifunctional riboflavin kinase/FAD synthetase [Bacillota bacterium]
MQIINGINRLPAKIKPLHVALGNFDGVHWGHQEILKSAVEKARKNKGYSAALVFDPHPLVALRPEQPLCLLTDIADRAEIMATLGLDYLIIEPFSRELANLSPEQFIQQILLNKLNIQGVSIGENYSFGNQSFGKAETLQYWGAQLGFEVTVIPMLRLAGKDVSSSKIRSLLLSGAVGEAAKFLNYYFFRQGKVIKGYGIGKKIVYPTANIAASPRLLWPGKGVYLTAVENLGSEPFFGVTNIGSQPTFSRHDNAVETHIINFSGTIYNHEIRLCFLEKLRDTKTFTSAEQLKEQIGRDIEMGKNIIEDLRQEKNGKSSSLQAGCSMLKFP